MQSVCVAALRGYKLLISPWLPSACRFHPTCSEYMRQAIEIHGVPRGIWLGILRLGKCHPLHKGGLDPVPQPNPAAGTAVSLMRPSVRQTDK